MTKRERRKRHFDFLRKNKVIDRKGKLIVKDEGRNAKSDPTDKRSQKRRSCVFAASPAKCVNIDEK